MKSPFTGGKTKLQKEKRKMTVRKEQFEIVYHYYLCSDTEEQFTTEESDELNYNQAMNAYREKHNLTFPDEIKNIREKYDVSAKRMSEILGFGVNMYRNYEAGELPSASNAKLIQMADDPQKFKELVKSSNDIDEHKKEKIILRIDEIIEKQNKTRFNKDFKKYLMGESKPTHLTGYRKPSLRKLTEMVVFFAEQLQPYKTGLNKLLFYADFLQFKKTGYSISGANYRAIIKGPVLNNFQSIFDFLGKEDVNINYSEYNDTITEQFKTKLKRTFKKKLFNEEELKTLHTIVETFKNMHSNKIVELSHKEKAWTENEKDRKLIDYTYGFDLKAIE